MNRIWQQPHPQRWSVLGVMALAMLVLSFQGGDGDVDPAHYPQPTKTPSSTSTPTSTPTPELEACQITEIFFNDQLYSPGTTATVPANSPLRVTLRVADAQGAPLIGANVDGTVTPLADIQAAAIPPLEDQSGTYDGVFTPLNAGLYTITFSVSDFSGPRFLPCSAEATIQVDPVATPTPTATPTATVTPTHTPTPTVIPEATIRVNPATLQTTLCRLTETSSIVAENVADLQAVELEISYDRRVIQVIDPDRPRPPVQVRPLLPSDWIINENRVDTLNGRIFFRATGASPINGTGGLIAIDWRPQQVGSSPVSLTRAVLIDSAGQPLNVTLQSGAVQVNFVPNCLTGTTALQGRTDYSGVIVTNSAGQQVHSDVDGYFAIITQGHLNFSFPGYLSAEADLPANLSSGAGAEATHLSTVGLLAGDINADNLIDILDLAGAAGHYQSTNPAADLNADGIVDILDLALIAANYRQRGPITAGQ